MNGSRAGDGSRPGQSPAVVHFYLKETTSDPELIPRLQHALQSKEKEVEQLKQRLATKDRAIASLESVTQKQLNQNARLHIALSLERKQGEKLKAELEAEKRKRESIKKMLELTHDVLDVAVAELEDDEGKGTVKHEGMETEMFQESEAVWL